MPAYFEIRFELKKSQTAIKDFCLALIDAGLVFKSGIWDAENDSLDDIIAYNQDKLDKNFQLGRRTPFSRDFRQMLFEFSNFSEVRLFITNVKKSSTFNFYLIIPEDDFLDYGKEQLKTLDVIEQRIVPKKLYHKMELIKNLSVKICTHSPTLIIQTSWELSEQSVDFRKAESGTKPLCEPFCIIPRHLMRDSWGLTGDNVVKDGIVLEDKENWNNMFSDVDAWVKCN